VGQAVKSGARSAVSAFVKGAPPQPAGEVRLLFESLQLTPRHILELYSVFHSLHQAEVEEEIFASTLEIRATSVIRLVKRRKKWVAKLLRALLGLGGCKQTVTWDQFLYVLLRFCSLSWVELAQTLFM